MQCEPWCASWGYEDCSCGKQVEIEILLAPEPTIQSVRSSGRFLVATYSNGISLEYRAIAEIRRLDPEPPKHLRSSSRIPVARLLDRSVTPTR